MKRFLPLLLTIALSATAGTLVQIRTPDGEIDLELFDTDKPVTVQNFTRLIDAGAYRNSFFHRLEPGFVVQGGGFLVYSNAFRTVPNFGPIKNEFAVGPRLSNTFGTVAMAKSDGNPNSATSHFFINLSDNSSNLDNQNGGFTVFGRVVSGTNILAMYNTFNYANRIIDMSFFYGTNLAVFSALPVTYTGWAPPLPSQLLYTDITLMRVAVSNLATGTEVSWNSTYATTNVVEFATGFAPPAWQELFAATGSGARMSFIDTNAAPGRFYRVRVR